jgi:hypothetical protein
VASIRIRTRKDGTAYTAVLYKLNGKQACQEPTNEASPGTSAAAGGAKTRAAVADPARGILFIFISTNQNGLTTGGDERSPCRSVPIPQHLPVVRARVPVCRDRRGGTGGGTGIGSVPA